MHTVKGTVDVQSLNSVLQTLGGEVLLTRVPEVMPMQCPKCSAPLFQSAPVTMRLGLVRQLETHSSPEPTATRALALKMLKTPDPLTLEDAELELLQAAVKANGGGFRDCALAVLLEYLDSAEPVPPAVPTTSTPESPTD